MKQTDILRRAKDYLDQLNRGQDPLSGAPLPSDSVGREPEVQKLFFLCSSNLKRIILYDENSPTAFFFITSRQRARLIPTGPSVALLSLLSQIDQATSTNLCRGLGQTTLCNWLMEQGLLVKEGRYLATPQGRALGIDTTEGIRFSPAAQQFVFDHLEDVSQWGQSKGPLRKLQKCAVEHRAPLESDRRSMELLSQGRHPLSEASLAAGEALAQERLRKCFAWVAWAFARSLERGCFTAKAPFSLPRERWAEIPVNQEESISLGVFLSSVNALLPDPTAMDTLAPVLVQEFLLSQGLVEEGRGKTGRKTYLLTPAGEQMGITQVETVASNGKRYVTRVYAPQAQQYLIDHMGEIIALAAGSPP